MMNQLENEAMEWLLTEIFKNMKPENYKLLLPEGESDMKKYSALKEARKGGGQFY